MLAQKTISKKKIIIYSVILALIFAVVFLAYWYFGGQYSNEQQKSGQNIYIAPAAGLPSAGELGSALSEKILDNPLFQKLKIHGRLPVEAGAEGRTNPFEGF